MIRLFCSPECAEFWVFGGTCVSLATSHLRSVSFCIVLCVDSAVNSQAVRNEAGVSTAKYECLNFFWKSCWNCFQISFTENKMKQKSCENTLNIKYVCAGVCMWQKRECESQTEVKTEVIFTYIYFYFLFFLNVASWADVPKTNFLSYALYKRQIIFMYLFIDFKCSFLSWCVHTKKIFFMHCTILNKNIWFNIWLTILQNVTICYF